ncbi:MAG: TolB-like 6-bladed beta-propeller domain-containing protein [Bacteroidales bacterium]|jgi:hypothetical protein|nr:TolB-like 6-bladed beta-propeller domain-containing protein [Bacteroidales bacterium]
MKKTVFFIFIIILSCSKKQDENTYSISDEHEYEVKSEIVFAAEGKDSLNYFYDIAIIDSFVIVTDIVSDTLVRIYKNMNFKNCLFKGLKGNGNSDFLSPAFINKAIDYDTIVIFDINSRRLKYIEIDSNNKISIIKSEFLYKTIPYMDEFNETENYIAGIDVNDGKVFIYNKNSQYLNKIDNYPDANKEYDEERSISLYHCRITVNEKRQSLCSALRSINCINFYNLEGERKKTIYIGKKLHFPQSHPIFVDFAHEKINFDGISGTSDYVYCLYRGIKSRDSTTDVKIFVFNWEGEHITTIKTDGNIFKITADKNNEYLLGLSAEADWNSTDIVKIPLEGVLKK